MNVPLFFSLVIGTVGAGNIHSDSSLLSEVVCGDNEAVCTVPSDETLGLMKALDSGQPSDEDSVAFIQASLHVQRRHDEARMRAGAGDPSGTSAESKLPAPTHLIKDKVVPIDYLQIMKRVFDGLNGTNRCTGGWTHGPVIIGGLSDSGTRGAQNVIKDLLNVTMQTAKVGPGTGDDQIMNRAIKRFWTSFLEHVDPISQDEYSNAQGLEQLADELCDGIKQSWKLAGEPKGLWGFKSPRSILITPVWNHLFNDGYRFIHVVLDPRANCAAKAHKDQVCSSLLSEAECAYVAGCFRYWAKVNGDVNQLFSNEGFESRYMYMSMDRLVLPEVATNSASYRMLKQELGKLSSLDGGRTITVDELLILKIMETEHKYVDSFKSKAFNNSAKLRDALIETTTDHDDVRQVITCLGYDIADWGIVADYDFTNVFVVKQQLILIGTLVVLLVVVVVSVVCRAAMYFSRQTISITICCLFLGMTVAADAITTLLATHDTAEFNFNPACIVLLVEILKLVASVALRMQGSAARFEIFTAEASKDQSPYALVCSRIALAAIQAGLYSAMNIMNYYAVGRSSTSQYVIFRQTSLLWNACLWHLVFRMTISKQRWAAILAIILGCWVQSIPNLIAGQTSIDWGISTILLQSFISALAAVVNEYVLKRNFDADINILNALLYLMGTLYAWGILMVFHPSRLSSLEAFFEGFVPLCWIIVVLQSLSGLCTSWILKYTDAITKGAMDALRGPMLMLVGVMMGTSLSASQGWIQISCDVGSAMIVCPATFVFLSSPRQELNLNSSTRQERGNQCYGMSFTLQ